MKYLIRNKGNKQSAHIWLDNDTSCKMYSTGGLGKKIDHEFKRYSLHDSESGKTICTMCLNNWNKHHAQEQI